MEDLQNDSAPHLLKSPLRYAQWWATTKPPTHQSTLVISVLSVAVAAGLTTAGSLVIRFVGPTGNVPGYVVVIVAGVFVTLGGLAAWRLTRAFYELQLASQSAQHELLTRAMTSELEVVKQHLATLQPDRESVRRLGIYFDHVYNLVDLLISGELSLADLASEPTRRSICGMTQELLKSSTGLEFVVSIWSEPPVGRIMTQVQRLPEPIQKLPDAVSDRFRNFAIVAAPDHTANECAAFEVHIEASWLKYNHKQEQVHAEKRLYRIDDLHMAGLTGDDLEAFREQGYSSVRATSVRRQSTMGYIVVLSRTPQAFTQVEGRYLLWLRHVLEVDDVIRNGRSDA